MRPKPYEGPGNPGEGGTARRSHGEAKAPPSPVRHSLGRWLSAAAAMGAMALPAGMASAEEYKPTGSARIGIETLSTTTSTSEGSHSLQTSLDLPKPKIFPSWVDAPSVQANLLTVNKNGFSVEPQVTWGMTFKPLKNLSVNLATSLGVDNYVTGLDDKKTTEYNCAPFLTPQLTINWDIPINDKNKFVISPLAGAKTYLAPLKFKTDDFERSRVQVYRGVNIAFVRDETYEIGTNIAQYPTDHAANERIAVWGDTYFKFYYRP